MKINFEGKNVIPSATIIGEAFSVGILAVLISFLLDFFGLQAVLNIVPKGWEVLVVVVLSVYIKHLISVKTNGREVI